MESTWAPAVGPNVSWAAVENLDEIATPGLLIYPDRVAHNTSRMLQWVGGDAARLRPHVKTHKMLTVMQLQVEAGIEQFKCATIAEAEVCARAGGKDVLLAYQPVGPHINRLAELAAKYPATSFSATVDCVAAAEKLAQRFAGNPLNLYIDVDVGMGRTGIAPGKPAIELVERINRLDGARFAGIHAYDGHIHDANPDARQLAFQSAREVVEELAETVHAPVVVAGGTPNFAFYAEHTAWQCSPGTSTLWDLGYGTLFPELGFQVAAVLLTRVVSRPGNRRICFDLGYKAIASESPLQRRLWLPGLPDAEFVLQNEEHLVAVSDSSHDFAVGDALYAFPVHICPTVALYQEATVIRHGRASGETWRVDARDRMLSV